MISTRRGRPCRAQCARAFTRFIATSDIHMEHKLRMSRDEVLETVGDMVQYAASLCKDVEFSPEDAGRSDRGIPGAGADRGDPGGRDNAEHP